MVSIGQGFGDGASRQPKQDLDPFPLDGLGYQRDPFDFSHLVPPLRRAATRINDISGEKRLSNPRLFAWEV